LYTIIINPAFWQTLWFKFLVAVLVLATVVVIYKKRINVIRTRAIQKAKHEKALLELEARALRAQMNPHFIFNCMNSIKALIQQDEKDRATNYLTTFSKLIRTIFQNSDKRDITLFDEIETCRLYTQLESMRFGDKLSYSFEVDETIDLKSIMVPALILQPFIENAIWHGIMPKEEGGVLHVNISKKKDKIFCVVEDNGIGRKVSVQNKFDGFPSHESKGVCLTQSRLELSNALNQRNATVEIIDKTTDNNEAGELK
jgi:sensor histidine kinase YesM